MSTERSSWLTKIAEFVQREPKDKTQLIEVLRDAEERELMSSEMLSMIESVLQVAEMQVREIMIPKVQMVAIDRTNSLTEIMPIITESGHSRFPVVDNENGEVIGILLAKDLLKYQHQGAQFDIDNILRPSFMVPESKRLDVLLKEFRAKRNHMAIVIDEYGHTAGLITIEDVLEQIVGEIEDEYDIDEEDHIKKHNDNLFTVKATTPIEDFNTYFQTKFDDEEFDTIGGIILQNFGHLPKRGETIKIANFDFKVLHCDQRRIHLLEVSRK